MTSKAKPAPAAAGKKGPVKSKGRGKSTRLLGKKLADVKIAMGKINNVPVPAAPQVNFAFDKNCKS
jgi:hypothetical protein